ncbi:MAG: 3-dehydroquinate synthase [Gammaproteobacteria bacterium]|nr:3-dehydroquinate synthase [Gammaproteobacteria bacterium]
MNTASKTRAASAAIQLALHFNMEQLSSSVFIKQGIAFDCSFWKEAITGASVCVVTSQSVADTYLATFIQNFRHFFCSTVILPDGETSKTIEAWTQILTTLVSGGHKRDTTIIALGGGVIGDVAGFASSCYHRGTRFIQVPTTLLSQVDAAIGGKTAVNFEGFKNLIGTFYQPNMIVIDPTFLETLPDRDYHAGLSEVIKYALIRDESFFIYLSTYREAIFRRDFSVLVEVIARCCRIKINLVESDPYDKTGKRALLNFGHTFAHALESATRYQYLHGEAVGWGMHKASELSHELGYLSADDLCLIRDLLRAYEVDRHISNDVTPEILLRHMSYDKKNTFETKTFILLKKCGKSFC